MTRTATRSPDDDIPFTSRELFGRLWRDYLSVHKWRMAGATLVMVIEGSTLAALSWLLKPLFDKVFVPGSGGSMAFVGGAIFGLFLVRAATSLIYKTMLTRISLKTSTAMQIDLLRHLLTLDGALGRPT